jgi:hypothetical protein
MSRLDELAQNAPVPTPVQPASTQPSPEAPVAKESDPARTLAIAIFWLGIAMFVGSFVVEDRSVRDLLLFGSVAAISVTLMLAQVKLFSIAADMRRIRELMEKRDTEG